MKIRYCFCLLLACLTALSAFAQSTWQRKYDAEQLGLDPIWPKAFGVMNQIASDTIFWYASFGESSSTRKVKDTSPYAEDPMKVMNAYSALLQNCAVQNEGIRRGYLASVAIDCPATIRENLIPLEFQGKVVSSCTRWLRSTDPDQKIPGALWHVLPFESPIEMSGFKADVDKHSIQPSRFSINFRQMCSMNLNGELLKPVN
jgi:hypothetical protein